MGRDAQQICLLAFFDNRLLFGQAKAKYLFLITINMKSSALRKAALAACVLGLLLLPLGCYQVSVSFEPEEESPAQRNQLAKTDSPSPATTSNNQKQQSVLTPTGDSAEKKLHPQSLRISNQTAQPVRLALLARSQAKSSKTNSSVPAHWDFAPGEGKEKGLILSLPNTNLKLEKGDVLVAFAQDGSRRYWGPYVVGETPAPTWNAQQQQWELVLSP